MITFISWRTHMENYTSFDVSWPKGSSFNQPLCILHTNEDDDVKHLLIFIWQRKAKPAVLVRSCFNSSIIRNFPSLLGVLLYSPMYVTMPNNMLEHPDHVLFLDIVPGYLQVDVLWWRDRTILRVKTENTILFITVNKSHHGVGGRLNHSIEEKSAHCVVPSTWALSNAAQKQSPQHQKGHKIYSLSLFFFLFLKITKAI